MPVWFVTRGGKGHPVEGDSAVAELPFEEELIGDVRMVGGELQIAFYPSTSGVREFDFDDFVAMLDTARAWLVSSRPDTATPS